MSSSVTNLSHHPDRVKPHSSWGVASSASLAVAAPGAEAARIIHSIWKTLRGPFLFPGCICPHQDWEVYDFQAAGCRACGSMHVCMEGVCQCEKNEEGQDICFITGCCIKMLSFSDKEFIDTVCFYMPASSSSLHRVGKGGCATSEDAATLQSVTQSTGPGAGNGNGKKRRRPSSSACSSSSSHLNPAPCSSSSSLFPSSPSLRCSVNKKNRYRSWVHSRMQLSSRCHVPAPPGSGCSSSGGGIAASYSQILQSRQGVGGSMGAGGCCLEDDSENVRSLIEMYVWDILCSRKWAESMKMEVLLHNPYA